MQGKALEKSGAKGGVKITLKKLISLRGYRFYTPRDEILKKTTETSYSRNHPYEFFE